MEELYTPQEVADKFRVTLRTVYQWIKDGKLKAIKVGTLWRISKDSLKNSSGSPPINSFASISPHNQISLASINYLSF